MKNGRLHIVFRSLIHYRTQFLYQFLIIMFLAAVITGSILIGSSVKTSVLNGNTASLNGSGIVISSGNRYLPASLAKRFSDTSGEKCEAIFEQEGWARNFETGESALNVQVIGVENSFFEFNSAYNGISIDKGETVINKKLAEKLNIKPGDDLILRIAPLSDLPADSPFAPITDAYDSFILTVTEILKEGGEENFSLGISQMRPYNLYLSINEFVDLFEGDTKINRILIKERPGLKTDEINTFLNAIFSAEDASLEFRRINNSGAGEIISERVFISANELGEISAAIPDARPVLTYLANSIQLNNNSTPYSFVAGMHQDLGDIIPTENGIVVNRWLAEDLMATPGDTITLSYFVVGSYKDFVEKSSKFVLEEIIETESTFLDSYLMPDFPGISGSESCRDWDAGAPVDMNKIRKKDEDYWYDYNGLPKAIINYNTALKIWGNDFGPATVIRFTKPYSEEDVITGLSGQINPFLSGVSIIPVAENARNAAKNSVDFTSLFLGLGFFILLSSIILLIMISSANIESRYGHIRVFRALGFKKKDILQILILETAIITILAGIAGSIAGNFFNTLLIRTLNSVWEGAVQTNTLKAYTDPYSLLTGFIATILIVLVTIRIQLGRQLKKVYTKEIRTKTGLFLRNINIIFYGTALVSSAIIIAAVFKGWSSTMLWFGAGSLVLILSIIFIAYLLKKPKRQIIHYKNWINFNSVSFFRMNPGRAIMPIIFLAAGLFIVIVTGANRKSFSSGDIQRGGGTGGFLFWAETATPLLYDINSARGKYEYNLEDEQVNHMHYLQIKRADGDDASCLNLNQVESPPLLGLDADYLSEKRAFSFASKMDDLDDPWKALSIKPENNTIYGIADQTVLQWSLLREVGDTLEFTSESGEELKVIIAGGLTSSIFQGHILLGEENFNKFYPSISGSSIFLAEGDTRNMESSSNILKENLGQYGIDLQSTSSRLAAFYEVTNTYLDVFITLGGIGMIMGVIGMGFVLLRNFNLRLREYALLLACGFSKSKIRISIIKEHLLILSAGIFTALISAPLATLPSLVSEAQIPVGLILIIIIAVSITGGLAILISVRKLLNDRLITSLRKE